MMHALPSVTALRRGLRRLVPTHVAHHRAMQVRLVSSWTTAPSPAPARRPQAFPWRPCAAHGISRLTRGAAAKLARRVVPLGTRRCSSTAYVPTWPPQAASGNTLEHVCFDDCPDRAGDFPVTIIPDFITEEQEAMLIKYFHNTLRRHRYQDQHWDGVITGYRELLIPFARMSEEVAAILSPIRQQMFHDPSRAMTELHVLDLSAQGHISRHVDGIKHSGDYVIGLCLGSPAVMQLHEHRPGLVPEDERGYAFTGKKIQLHLPRRCIYSLSGESRYDWAHEVLPGDQVFKGKVVYRERRISLMFRDYVEGETPPHAAAAGYSAPSHGGDGR